MDRLSYWFYDQLSDMLSFDDLKTLAYNFLSPRCWRGLLKKQEKKRKQFKLEIYPHCINKNLLLQYDITWMRGRGSLSLEKMDERFEKRFTHIRRIIVDGDEYFKEREWAVPKDMVETFTALAPKADSDCHFQFDKSALFKRAVGSTTAALHSLLDTLFLGPIGQVRFSSVTLHFKHKKCFDFFEKQVDHGRLQKVELQGEWPQETNSALSKVFKHGKVKVVKVEYMPSLEPKCITDCADYWKRTTSRVDIKITGNVRNLKTKSALLGKEDIIYHPSVNRRILRVDNEDSETAGDNCITLISRVNVSQSLP
uniref:FTH domain-containing protein n=1 Tax=Steinernema glaseri TaxID=37863 RepID=A0A1I7YC46_9BILA